MARAWSCCLQGACCPTTILYVAVHHKPLMHCMSLCCHACNPETVCPFICSTSTSRPMAARLSAVARPQSQGILPQASGPHHLLPTDQRPQILLKCHWLRAWLPLCRMGGVCFVCVLHVRARPSGSHLADAAVVSRQGTVNAHFEFLGTFGSMITHCASPCTRAGGCSTTTTSREESSV